MSLSRDLYQLQKFDSTLDSAQHRIEEIDQQLADTRQQTKASQNLAQKESIYHEKHKAFKQTEAAVDGHNQKIEQNQKRLYGGSITNPKELEDLQLEAESLQNYLAVLEDRQLEAMLEMEEAETQKSIAADSLKQVIEDLEAVNKALMVEKAELLAQIRITGEEKESFLEKADLPDLATYQAIRSASGGIAVSLMAGDSCSSCGANIPSAIAQEARSPGILAFCPTCKRILHPG